MRRRARLPSLRRAAARLPAAARWLSTLPAVATTERLSVSTGWREAEGVAPRHIPLAMNDVYVLHEQLPYAYFFRETLSAERLASSLAQVLAAFPALGGRLCLDSNAIVLAEDDTVPLSVGHTATPLDEWMALGHGVDAATGRPALLPIFDALPHDPWSSRTPLARVRITFLEGGGTCIGVNISHAAADGASCIRFVYCWGRQHRGLPYPIPSNDRAHVTVNGMLTPDKADLMNLRPAGAASSPSLVAQACSQVFGFSAAMLNLAPADKPAPEPPEDSVPHGFILLPFRECHLSAMKRHGCAEAQAAAEHGVPFVSTNDMVTSAGWMLMRRLSGREENSMNIVVNIRGRVGTEPSELDMAFLGMA